MNVARSPQYHSPRTLMVIMATWFYVTEASSSRNSLLPVITDNPSTVVHDEGDMAILYCSVLNLQDHTVTWRKLPNSSPLTIGTKSWTRDLRVHAEHVPNSSQWNLVIEKVSVADAGEYECQISKRRSQLRHKVTLVVKAKPAALLPRIEISGENVLRTGSLLKLTCNASLADVAMESIVWIKDGEPLLQGKDNRYSVHSSVTLNGQNSGVVSSRLEVKDTRTDDSGVYLCRSTERIQMAGVKVEIQGTHNFKRADIRKLGDSKEISEFSHAGSKGTVSSWSQFSVWYLFCFTLSVYATTCDSFTGTWS
ncbi:hypothetical protein BsWGS_02109 [Bradybaena similaris]